MGANSVFSLTAIFGFLSVLSILGAIGCGVVVVVTHLKNKQRDGVEASRSGNVEMKSMSGRDKHQELREDE